MSETKFDLLVLGFTSLMSMMLGALVACLLIFKSALALVLTIVFATFIGLLIAIYLQKTIIVRVTRNE